MVGSPPCTAWSVIQNLNARSPEGASKLEEAKRQALVHLQFCAAMYREQITFEDLKDLDFLAECSQARKAILHALELDDFELDGFELDGLKD